MGVGPIPLGRSGFPHPSYGIPIEIEVVIREVLEVFQLVN